MPKTCIVQYCSSVSRADSRAKGLTFHRLPVDEGVRKKWLDNIQRTNLDGSPWEPYKHATVCSNHFHPSCFHGPKLGPDAVEEETEVPNGQKKPMRRILYPNAIPTLNMGLKGHHKIVHKGSMLPGEIISSRGGSRKNNKPATADRDIIKSLGISKSAWTRLQPQEKIDQRRRILTWSTCLVDHNYSSSIMFGAERLADENKYLRIQIEKLVQKYEAEKIKATRTQSSLAKACTMLEQCSEYEFFDHEGQKIAKPRTGKKGKLKKPLPKITARHKTQLDDRRRTEKVENCVVTPGVEEEEEEVNLTDLAMTTITPEMYGVNEDILVETSFEQPEHQFVEYQVQNEEGEEIIYTMEGDDQHFVQGEDGTVFFEAIDPNFAQY